MKIAVICAHPDDETLGMGATLARLAAKGHSLSVAILGEGPTSRQWRAVPGKGYWLPQLTVGEDCRKAAAIIGVSVEPPWGLPDNRFDREGILSITRRIEQWLGGHEPSIVYTHHPGDLNVDHRLTCQAVLTATRPTPGQAVREVYAFEVPSSTEWAFGCAGLGFRPNVFVDVSETVEAKIKAFECYESEIRQFPHPRSSEAIRARAQYWGSVSGCHYAEAFELLRAMR